VILRLSSFLVPRFLLSRGRIAGIIGGTLQDSRLLKALSLLLLELLTIVPGGVFTNLLADFIPFSIGAVVVLGQFKTFEQFAKF